MNFTTYVIILLTLPLQISRFSLGTSMDLINSAHHVSGEVCHCLLIALYYIVGVHYLFTVHLPVNLVISNLVALSEL